MKTSIHPFYVAHPSYVALGMVIMMVNLQVAYAQEEATKTLFGPDTKIGFVWSPELKINSIQGKTGTLIGFYGGALLQRSTLFGVAVGANVGHPTVNYSYIGLISQYTYRPQALVHGSIQLLFATGTTKDYEQTKSSTMDNFMNTSGTGFTMIEPGMNGELNLSKKVRLVGGLSYRYAWGLDESSLHVERTQLKNNDLSGLNVNVGVKFGVY